MAELLASPFLFYAHPAAVPFHLAYVFGLLLIHAIYKRCPLTALEQWALRRADVFSYNTGFYQYYLFDRLLKRKVSDRYVTNLLLITKIAPGIIPAYYLF